MALNADNRTTLVLGLGNVLLSDEGFGVHVVRRLRGCELPDDVRVVEGGVGGLNLLGYLEGVKRLIIVDVMMHDSPPGQLLLLKPGTRLDEPGKRLMSFHQMGVLELLKTWRLIGEEPEVYLLVTVPQCLELGTELSPVLQSACTEAVEIIKGLCANSSERNCETCIR
jgi:hydrogenase maturation protease